MPSRFIFRQIDYRDLDMILNDQEVRSKSHRNPQRCHQTSYAQIVEFRGGAQFNLPHGGVVNDYAAFYFSPVTAFTYTIHRGNVNVISPNGNVIGASNPGDRLFLVANAQAVMRSRLRWSFSNYALNSHAPAPLVVSDPAILESHVNWALFDEAPLVAIMPEIGYDGVCQWFQSTAAPHRQLRKEARMAEFIVKDALPTNMLCGIIAQNRNTYNLALSVARNHRFGGQVLLKPDCFI